MVLSSAFVTVIGGFIVIQSGNITNNIKYAIFFTLLSFLIALIAGLKNLHNSQGFWLKVAEHKHQEGPMVIEDESKDYKSLNEFRSKLQDYRDEAPKKSKVYARKIQTWAFVIGIVLFIIATVVLLFNFPQEESRTKPQHNSLKYYKHQ